MVFLTIFLEVLIVSFELITVFSLFYQAFAWGGTCLFVDRVVGVT